MILRIELFWTLAEICFFFQLLITEEYLFLIYFFKINIMHRNLKLVLLKTVFFNAIASCVIFLIW